MPDNKEDELLKKLGVLTIYWVGDRGHLQSLIAFTKNMKNVSKRTGISESDLKEIYKLINRKTEEMFLDKGNPSGPIVVKGFQIPPKDDTPTSSG